MKMAMDMERYKNGVRVRDIDKPVGFLHLSKAGLKSSEHSCSLKILFIMSWFDKICLQNS